MSEWCISLLHRRQKYVFEGPLSEEVLNEVDACVPVVVTKIIKGNSFWRPVYLSNQGGKTRLPVKVCERLYCPYFPHPFVSKKSCQTKVRKPPLWSLSLRFLGSLLVTYKVGSTFTGRNLLSLSYDKRVDKSRVLPEDPSI